LYNFRADPIPPELITSPEIQFLIAQMKKVQESYSLVGLASPQIGIELRMFVMSFGDHLKEKFKPDVYKAKEMSTSPFTVFINPQIKVLDHKKIVFEESCASIVGFAAEVARSYSVQVDALDGKGQPISHIFTGWNARIAQHENDHLDGILFTDLMDRSTLRCTNWEAVNAKGGRIEVPYYPK
jgi:peptide deformylase